MIENPNQEIKSRLDSAKQAHQNGELQKAATLYQSILKEEPNHFEILYLLGTLHAQGQNYNVSLKLFEQALKIRGDHAGLLANYSHLLYCLSLEDEALLASNKLLQLTPDNAGGWHNRSFILEKLGDIKSAKQACLKATQLMPENIDYQARLGLMLFFSGDEEGALAHINNYRKTHPKDIRLLSVLNKIYSDSGYYHLEKEIINEILRLDPNHSQSLFNLSLSQFLRGDFYHAWQNYEARWQSVAVQNDYSLIEIRKQIGAPFLTKHHIENTNIQGKSIIIYSEQGLGDVLQFTRFFPHLKEMGMIVKFLPRKSHQGIIPLLKNHPSLDDIVDIKKPFRRPDYQIGLMSFGLLFGIDEQNIPFPLEITLKDETYQKWQKIIHQLDKLYGRTKPNNRKRIGFFTRGSGRIKGRDLTIQEWAPIFALKEFDFFCLQKDINDEERIFISTYDNLFAFDDHISDLADTSALMRHCDKVISIDSSIAHLAGMVGKQNQSNSLKSPDDAFLWLILGHYPTFRWMLRRTDSPWYKNAYLWRSHKHNNWQRLIEKIHNQLLGWNQS